MQSKISSQIQLRSVLKLSPYVFLFNVLMIMFLASGSAQAESSHFFDEVKIRSDLMFGSIETLDLTEHYNSVIVIQETMEQKLTENQIEKQQQGEGSDPTANLSVGASPIPSGETSNVANDINKDLLVADKIINLGEKIWNIVQKGKALINYSGSMASALPAHIERWEQLENWQTPQTKVVRVIYKNMFGLEVARLTYRIVLLYGGHSNGVGQYIGYATIEPLEIVSSYLYNIDAKVSVASVYNKGDSKNPVAAMILNITWSIETVFKKVLISHAYNLDGTGHITELGNAKLIEQD